MQHNRQAAAVVFGDIFGPEPAWKGKIQLQSPALPYPADRIFQRKLDFRPVKRALAGISGAI